MTRAQHLLEISEQLRDRSSDIASLLSWESGKSLAEATGEIAYSISYLDHFAKEISNPTGYVISTNPSRHSYTTAHPVGLVFSVTPWNFPLAMFARKFAPVRQLFQRILHEPTSTNIKTGLRSGMPVPSQTVRVNTTDIIIFCAHHKRHST